MAYVVGDESNDPHASPWSWTGSSWSQGTGSTLTASPEYQYLRGSPAQGLPIVGAVVGYLITKRAMGALLGLVVGAGAMWAYASAKAPAAPSPSSQDLAGQA